MSWLLPTIRIVLELIGAAWLLSMVGETCFYFWLMRQAKKRRKRH